MLDLILLMSGMAIEIDNEGTLENCRPLIENAIDSNNEVVAQYAAFVGLICEKGLKEAILDALMLADAPMPQIELTHLISSPGEVSNDETLKICFAAAQQVLVRLAQKS